MIEKNWMTLIKPKKLNITVDEHNPNLAKLVAEPACKVSAKISQILS